MPTIELTNDVFEKTVTSPGITLVDFWADWCGPCKMFAPIYDAASEKNPDVTFAKVDTEAEQALAGAAGISAIPTLMAFRDGVLVFSQAGALPGPALDQVIEAVKGLDMDEVHRQIAAQQAAETTPEA
ncbi:thioredoxin [Lacisediminihabitans changchengi]|uniref:Thioredoxin n=1 Tax=Lacisediminihabitans changchengi TaxID=2787634 RepID=A0A934VYW9_9MICO|nr:thioredoxin [Lacisediminihabitans changchengi]MBK4348497.1 thioredoxin [Lacisediminihabitans changchengi]